MTFITSDQIRDISVKTVEMFLNSKVPLSEGLAKQASDMELNSDQIQRAVEATNSIAYLKILSLASDRTVEFPLCKYAEVMAHVATPDLTKAASYVAQNVGKTTPASVEMVKAASVANSVELSDAEKHVMFVKLAAANDKALEALRDREITIAPELQKIASVVKADPEGLEKLATVANGEEFKAITKIVYGEYKPHSDTGLFKSAELKQVERLAFLVKEASAIKEEIADKEQLAQRCEMVKQAFLGAIGRGIGTVAGKLMSAPIKVTANAAKRTGQNIGASLGNAATSAGNTVRGAMGKPLKPLNLTPKKKFGLGAIAGTAATIGFDASMYSPGTDKTTGRSKDVWTTLQREPNNF